MCKQNDERTQISETQMYASKNMPSLFTIITKVWKLKIYLYLELVCESLPKRTKWQTSRQKDLFVKKDYYNL